MIKVSIGSSTHRGTPVIVDPATTTAKDVVADSEFAALKGQWSLDGTILTDAEMNKPLTEVIAGMNYDSDPDTISLSNITPGKNA